MSGGGSAAAEARPPDVIEVFERRGEVALNRAGAFLLDQMLLVSVSAGLTALLLFAASLLGAPPRPSAALWLLVVLWVVLWLAYMTACEAAFGATAGKAIGVFPLSLRVISADGAPLSWRQALVRAAVGLVEDNPLLLGIPALVAISVDSRHRRLGDRAAGTLIVDRSKLRAVRFAAGEVELERLDGTRARFAALDDAFVSAWLGKPQYLVLAGRDGSGVPQRVRANYLAGATVFGGSERMEYLRAWLEWRFGRPFPQKLQVWRLLFVLVGMAFALLAFLTPLVLSVLLRR